MSSESLGQAVANNTNWINSVISNSKLSSQLAELSSIDSLDQKIVVQEGELDAKYANAKTIRGYKGNWEADTNNPVLSNGSGVVGDIYKVSIGGNINIGSGSIDYVAGDLVYLSEDNWIKISPNQISDITGLQLALDSLADGLIPQGTWNADTNDPDIDGGIAETGYFWIVSYPGTTDVGGITDWEINDWAVKTATGWAKIDNTDKVLSVAGRTGVIVLSITDITGLTSALANCVKLTGDQSIAGEKTFTEVVTITNRLSLSDSTNNSFIGSSTGLSNTTGATNVGLGNSALYSNTTGSTNVGIGSSALYSNTTGGSNVGIGLSALYSNTTGTFNIALGQGTLADNIGGNLNIALGIGGLRSNTTGGDNISLGYDTLGNNTTGSYNVGLGYKSGLFIADGSANTQCSSSIFIGKEARANGNNQTNQIVIGGGAVGNGSNTVTLGNDSIVKTILKGSVGIGTDSPDTVLNLEGLKNTSIITLGSTNNDGGWSVGDKIGAINFYSYDGSSSAGAGLKGSISYENEQGNTGEYLSLVFRTAGRNTGTNNTERMRIDSDGNTAFSGSISTTGTISGVLANGVTATTQTAGDNSTKVATTAYANAAGITTAQANEIAANTLKVGYTDALVSANVSVVANTAKVGITTQQAADIVVNNAKVGITTAQANAIVTNTTNIATNTNEIATNTIAPQSAGQSINYIPIYTDTLEVGNSIMAQSDGVQNAKFINVYGRMTMNGGGGDANGGTLNLTSNSARLGIATNSITGNQPEAALDVGKNARVRGSLNVGLTNEQYLFVSTTGDTPVGYVKMGYYGTGTDYDSSGGAQAATQYTTAFSNGGKICEDERIMTFVLSRATMVSLGGLGVAGKELIPQDSNFTYIVKEAYIYSVPTSGGRAPTFNASSDLQIAYQTVNNGTRTTTAYKLGTTEFNASRSSRKLMTFEQSKAVAVGTINAVPKSSVRISLSGGISDTGAGDCDFYIRMRVKNIDFNDDIKNNSQLITIS